MTQRPQILVLYAHPHPRKSRVNRRLIERVAGLPHVTVHDLYALYPDFQVNVEAEQALLLQHDVIVFQHPMYWYSSPALLKEWQDAVLLHDFAYGEQGTALAGKHLQSVITAAGSVGAYTPDGLNHFTIDELLRPFERTAGLCQMIWRQPRVIHDSKKLDDATIRRACDSYHDFLLHYTTATGE